MNGLLLSIDLDQTIRDENHLACEDETVLNFWLQARTHRFGLDADKHIACSGSGEQESHKLCCFDLYKFGKPT